MPVQERIELLVRADHVDRTDVIEVAVVRRVWLDAILEIARRFEQDLARGNDGDVGGAEMLPPPFRNGAHAVRHGHVLLATRRDPREVLRTLHVAIDQIVVVADSAWSYAIDQRPVTG